MRKFLIIPLLLFAGYAYGTELGAGNGSGYPGVLDTDLAVETSTHTAREEVPNDSNAAIVAIQTALGTTSSGALFVSTANINQTILGNKTFDGVTRFGTGIRADTNYLGLSDDIEIRMGTATNDFAFGYDSGADEVRVVRGSDVTTDANVAWRVTESTVVAIGDSGSLTYADGSGDLYVEHVLEVDGASYFTGTVNVGGNNGAIAFLDLDDDVDDYFFTEYSADRITTKFWDSSLGEYKQSYGMREDGVVFISSSSFTSFTYVDGEGDLYVENDVEIDGGMYGTVRMHNASQQLKLYDTDIGLGDWMEFSHDAGYSHIRHYVDSENEYKNQMQLHKSGVVAVSSNTFAGFSFADGEGDLFIEKDTEVGANLFVENMKTGTTQGGAGAAAGELWSDTDDDDTIKLGQ